MKTFSVSTSKLFGQTVRGLSWQSLSVLILAVLHLLVLMILARCLTPADFGLTALVNVIIIVTTNAFNLGLGPAVIQRKNLTSDDIGFVFVFSVLSGIMATCLLWLFAPIIGKSFGWMNMVPMIRVAGVAILINNMALVSSAKLQKEMKFELSSLIEVGSFVVGYAIPVILMAKNGYGAWSLIFGILLQSAVKSIANVLISPPVVKFHYKLVGKKSILGYGGAMTLTQVLNQVALQGDNYIVGRFLGAVALGLYERAFFLIAIASRYFGRVLDTVMFPAMAKIQDRNKSLRTAYLAAISMLNTVLFPVGVAGIVLAREIVLVILGQQWLAAVLPFRILMIAISLRTTIRIVDSFARAVGHVGQNAIIKSIYAFLIISFSLVCVRFGISGVAVGVTLVVIIHYIMMLVLVRSVIDISWRTQLNAHLPGLFFGGIVLIITELMRWTAQSWGFSDFWVLIFALIMAFTGVLVVFFVFPQLLGESNLWLIRQLLSKTKRDNVIVRRFADLCISSETVPLESKT